MRPGKIVRSLIAGSCGSLAHSCLMYLKSAAGLLPSFEPYDDLQRLMSHLIGTQVPPLVPWALSFLNGAVVLGFLFGKIYPRLPGRSGAIKGLVFGSVSWIAMGLLFFPALGQGLFGANVGLGIEPALFSLAMLLTYSVTMGMTYSALLPIKE
jgi:hypothetical protein